jgi:hypothetical protein
MNNVSLEVEAVMFRPFLFIFFKIAEGLHLKTQSPTIFTFQLFKPKFQIKQSWKKKN